MVEFSTNAKPFGPVACPGLKNSNLIGHRLRKLRNEAALSQEALAAKCQRLGWDASREMINHVEMQIRLVRDYEIVALAEALEVEPKALLPTKAEAFQKLSKK